MISEKKYLRIFLLFAGIAVVLTIIIHTDNIENIRLSKNLFISEPQIVVPVNIIKEEFGQKQVDDGHSPWRLDLIQSTITFVSLKISPEGIIGPFPVKEEDIKVIQETNIVAVVEVCGDFPVQRIYFQRLIRQNETGIWTVVGYDVSS